MLPGASSAPVPPQPRKRSEWDMTQPALLTLCEECLHHRGAKDHGIGPDQVLQRHTYLPCAIMRGEKEFVCRYPVGPWSASEKSKFRKLSRRNRGWSGCKPGPSFVPCSGSIPVQGSGHFAFPRFRRTKGTPKAHDLQKSAWWPSNAASACKGITGQEALAVEKFAMLGPPPISSAQTTVCRTITLQFYAVNVPLA